MMCDAVGDIWLATARCCWQLRGEVDHAEPCWTLSLRCHRHDGDLPGLRGSLQNVSRKEAG